MWTQKLIIVNVNWFMFLREMENYIKHYEIIHLEEKYWQKGKLAGAEKISNQ